MPADKKNIIRHPELTRLTDDQLINEIIYEREQCYKSAERLLYCVNDLSIIIGKINISISLRHLHEDFILHTDRLQAIREEIEFRKI